MDKLAKAVGLSPLEVRLINAFHEGDISHTGNKLVAVSTIETLKKVAYLAGEKLAYKYQNISSK